MTANQRLRRTSRRAVAASAVLAVAAHAALLAANPGYTIVARRDASSSPLVAVEQPPVVEIPRPPAPIGRPAEPVVSELAIDADPTIDADPFHLTSRTPGLEPPPAGEYRIDPNVPAFIPVTTYPRLLNRREAEQWTEYEYPSILGGTAIAGAPLVWILLDETGTPVKSMIHESSGYAVLDRAALRVAKRMKFAPAENRGVEVPVWVSIAIRFQG